MTEKEILQREIDEAKLRLKTLEEKEKKFTRSKIIKGLDEYTPEEKIKWFDKKYSVSLSELEDKESGNYHEDNDNDHYAWEFDIEILARDHRLFWDYWNNL